MASAMMPTSFSRSARHFPVFPDEPKNTAHSAEHAAAGPATHPVVAPSPHLARGCMSSRRSSSAQLVLALHLSTSHHIIHRRSTTLADPVHVSYTSRNEHPPERALFQLASPL
jgi:hypothetical protein